MNSPLGGVGHMFGSLKFSFGRLLGGGGLGSIGSVRSNFSGGEVRFQRFGSLIARIVLWEVLWGRGV